MVTLNFQWKWAKEVQFENRVYLFFVLYTLFMVKGLYLRLFLFIYSALYEF